MIKVDLSGAEKFFAEGGPDYAAAAKAHETLVGRTGAGANFTGRGASATASCPRSLMLRGASAAAPRRWSSSASAAPTSARAAR